MSERIRSPFASRPTSSDADTSSTPAEPSTAATAVEEQPTGQPAEQPTPPPPAGDAAAGRPRLTWLDLLETRMPALGAQRLPSTATVRAYHKDGSYVPWESGLLGGICRAHGVVAWTWCFVFTSIAWLGAGDHRRRLRKFRKEGLPGLYRSQLPPLDALHGFSRVWVAWWSAVAWSNLKVTRLPIALCLYVFPATGPFWWPSLWSLLRLIFTK
ncbi:hypothetical protein AB0392_32270 [Nonomuraea angiospora]|uniref:hypothetical protein n=1 Tax=Nonomuraea angiospora TaxID=46172 RepID=UPI00344D6AE6